MPKKFSSQELFELRNFIPVEMLIREQLEMPSKISEGFFRFLCPICNEFQTAINPATNLARCFRCERNFNTIDLVMTVQRIGFKESVLFLKRLMGKVPDQNKDARQGLQNLVGGIGQTMPGGLG
ncbi:DnaG6 [Desulforapulum autotrophicum HRM2]|uniref:DnaG11 n=1 Tax=Desulforapulum autotrophicum (strain ATCC 43914 / DSM 3382 / VKM B-1955 / HRM2) TaxID=177437 RepID=C0QC38_DESAH|nr:CHC2 zinc finger domain-containing protein [Desulforapulum autotrophicum]ACN15709.1 DnaG8 [Desulforapulum autotrophicum HRM2]ACN17055.1 DnaG11 [Desulforapulum autotrophicum HRM2]ACN17690.1 DnaG6 [Desulforapulum autotrophicum HRM2]